MPFEICFSESDGGVVTTYFGVVTDDDLIRSVEEKCPSEEKIRSYRYALTDCTKVDEFNVTTDGVIRNAQLTKFVFSVNPDVILVAAVPTDLMFGMSRLWQVYADDSHHRTKVVRTREEAEEWLAERL